MIFFKKKDKKEKVEDVKKSFIKDTFKMTFMVSACVFVGYRIISRETVPDLSGDRTYLDLQNVIKNPNVNESTLDFIEKNAKTYFFKPQFIKGSSFIPVYKYVTVPQIEIMRKFSIYYYLEYIENGTENKYFKYDIKRLDITNISSLKSGVYSNGISVLFNPEKISGTDDSYNLSSSYGSYRVSTKITDIDEINAINLTSADRSDIYLICTNLNKKSETDLEFSNCKTEYSYALQYFTDLWKNINSSPMIIQTHARLFFEYYILTLQNLNPKSVCYSDDYKIYEYKYFVKDCSTDVKNADDDMDYVSNEKYRSNIDFSIKVSKSLFLRDEDLSTDYGFNPIGYRYKAEKLILQTYIKGYYTNAQLMATKEVVLKHYNKQYPAASLDLGTYTNQDIYDIVNADKINQMKALENGKRENEEKAKKRALDEIDNKKRLEGLNQKD